MAVVTVFLELFLQRFHLLAEHSLLLLHLGDQFVSLCQVLLQLLLVSSQLEHLVFGCHRFTVTTCLDFGKLSRTPGQLQYLNVFMTLAQLIIYMHILF